MNANILKLKEEAQQLRSLAEERALTSEENMRVERIAEQVRCEKLVDAFDAAPSVNIRQTNEEFAQLVADAVAGNRKIEVRAQNDKASVEPLTPVHIGDIIEPLEKGMILDKLGCKIQTGLTGDWKYPVVQSIDAYIAGENVTISDSALTLAKVTPVPRRVTLGIAVSNMADWASEYEIKDIVLSQLTKAAARALNKWMFSATAIALQGESGTTINGLFSSLASGNSLTATTTGAPTYAEILGLKAAVDSTGVVPDNTAAFVMNNAMAAVLSGTPKASTVVAGFVLENGMINGIPVYITEYAPANTVYFGYFSYGLVGQFGETSITIDPFSGIAENKIKFWFNSAFDIKQARQEAFGKLA